MQLHVCGYAARSRRVHFSARTFPDFLSARQDVALALDRADYSADKLTFGEDEKAQGSSTAP